MMGDDRIATGTAAHTSTTRSDQRPVVGRWRVALRLLALTFGLGVLLAMPVVASADPGDLGFEGPDGNGSGAAPSGSKPQAKIWFNDGIWWASMWDVGTSDFYIWKLDRSTETWSRTATRLDDRNATRADVLWDGNKLYVASHIFSESDGSGLSRLYRFSYNSSTDTYAQDAGFPATINNVRAETLVIDKDSTGTLWATWEQGARVWVSHTSGGDTNWVTPYIVPGTPTIAGDDISTLIAFGGNKIGVMYSNQNGSPDADEFVIHTDGQSDMTWGAPETADSGSGVSDDHLNLKTDASGRVYAVVKTGLSGSSPLIKFLVRATNGTWTDTIVATGSDSHTRPILIVDEANAKLRIYMTHGQSGGPIVEKVSPINAISWPSGTGTPVIWDASSDDMNNPTSTKQNVTAASGLIVVAYEDTTKHYWHGDIFGGGGADTTPPTVSTRSPASGATGVPTGTNVSATFSEAVTGVSASTFTLEGPGGSVAATVSYNAGTHTATLDPNATLTASTTYTAHLTSGIADLATNPLAATDWTFTTAVADTTAPTVTQRSPVPAATAVATGADLTAT
ncbi:MAG: Ig-like domain-containing protein, partial [Candidatus Limnocylindrales bacterium]